ncbi:MAG: NAD(P)-dependent oxidoreductase [Nitrospirae bacterium]|nr:NAD(P)-dependent oxidoreductase [Nitrospirota bacterium]
MSHKVGFIGMGIMGQPMSRNILKAGYEVMVYNRTREKTLPLKEAGALVAETPAEVASWADVIILMLTGPEAIDAVLEGDRGLLSANPSGKVIVNMSTVSPSYSVQLNERLVQKGITLLDAPVSGSKKPAEEATLIILASGPEQAVRQLEPLLLTMGKKVVYCGEAGKGSSMKMMINLLLGIMMEALAEAINFGLKAGLSVDAMLDVVLSGPLSCGLFNLKTEMMKTDEFPPQFPLKHMLKDLRFVLQTADEKGASVPTGHTVFQLYRQAAGHGLSEMDFAAVKRVISEMSDQ